MLLVFNLNDFISSCKALWAYTSKYLNTDLELFLFRVLHFSFLLGISHLHYHLFKYADFTSITYGYKYLRNIFFWVFSALRFKDIQITICQIQKKPFPLFILPSDYKLEHLLSTDHGHHEYHFISYFHSHRISFLQNNTLLTISIHIEEVFCRTWHRKAYHKYTYF